MGVVATGNITLSSISTDKVVFYPWIEEWNSTATSIGGKYIISPQIFAGEVHDGEFSGIYMGTEEVSKEKGIFGFNNGKGVFHITKSDANIAGWKFDADSIYSGEKKHSGYSNDGITLSKKGIRGHGWRLEEDGSGGLAADKIKWDADGNLIIRGAFSQSLGGEDKFPITCFRGIWSEDETYYNGDVVIYEKNGKRSQLILLDKDLYDNSLNKEPTSDNGWEVLVSSGQDGGSGWRVELFASPGASLLREGQDDYDATLDVRCWRNDKEVTEEMGVLQFVWERHSEYGDDEIWNQQHKYEGHLIKLSISDINGDTEFICKVYSEENKHINTITF